MLADSMPLTADLNEKTQHGSRSFPIQYYVDELYQFTNRMVPLHWHSELELFVVSGGAVQMQVQDRQIRLNDGEGVFVNANILHSFQQVNSDERCQCPNIVFSKEMIGAGVGSINQSYIAPIIMDKSLPFVVFTQTEPWHREILDCLDAVFSLLQRYGAPGCYDPFPTLDFDHKDQKSRCFEMRIQCLLSEIWQSLYAHWERIPRIQMEKKDFAAMIRIQKMLAYIHSHYAKPITLHQIAASAEVEKSEASRCFQKYMQESPVQYLIHYRLERAKQLLEETTKTASQISYECGFQSNGYFGKRFLKETGVAPLQYRKEKSALPVYAVKRYRKDGSSPK
ncbi:MAG: helix-turn-helix domain-containing protein [Eubacteriales bacterium]|nr:helix-turn-helix domain-containing protein [Eubacteriales bacterium]